MCILVSMLKSGGGEWQEVAIPTSLGNVMVSLTSTRQTGHQFSVTPLGQPHSTAQPLIIRAGVFSVETRPTEADCRGETFIPIGK